MNKLLLLIWQINLYSQRVPPYCWEQVIISKIINLLDLSGCSKDRNQQYSWQTQGYPSELVQHREVFTKSLRQLKVLWSTSISYIIIEEHLIDSGTGQSFTGVKDTAVRQMGAQRKVVCAFLPEQQRGRSLFFSFVVLVY